MKRHATIAGAPSQDPAAHNSAAGKTLKHPNRRRAPLGGARASETAIKIFTLASVAGACMLAIRRPFHLVNDPREDDDAFIYEYVMSAETSSKYRPSLSRRNPLRLVTAFANKTVTPEHGLPQGHPRTVEPISDFDPYKSSSRRTYYTDVGDDCHYQYEWQERVSTTCNIVHEFDLADGITGDLPDKRAKTVSRLINNGDFRDVWATAESLNATTLAMKTLRYEYSYKTKYLEMFRYEAAAFSHLTASKFVADFYGSCGASLVMNFSSGSNFKKLAKKHLLSSEEKLKLSYHVASAVADIQDFERTGKVSMVVGDVSAGQFVKNEKTGIYQIIDINLVKMITEDAVSGEMCKFLGVSDAGWARSPEEYASSAVDDKIDVWAVSNTMHYILAGGYWFLTSQDESKDTDVFLNALNKGVTPGTINIIEETGDDIERALLNVIKKSRYVDPQKRLSTAEIRDYLEEQILVFLQGEKTLP